jgi:hypothetical protein
MKKQRLKLTKMDGENLKQYWAWLLYCEMESMNKMLAEWKRIAAGGKPRETLKGIEEKIGKSAARSTIVNWSNEFRWVKRREWKERVQSRYIFERIKKAKAEEHIKFTKALSELKLSRK